MIFTRLYYKLKLFIIYLKEKAEVFSIGLNLGLIGSILLIGLLSFNLGNNYLKSYYNPSIHNINSTYEGFGIGYNLTRSFKLTQVDTIINLDNTFRNIIITTRFYVTIKGNGTYNVMILLPFHLHKLTYNDGRIIYKNYSHGTIIGTSREYHVPKDESVEVYDIISISFYSNDTFISGGKGKYLLVFPFYPGGVSYKEIDPIQQKLDVPFVTSNLTKTFSVNFPNQFIVSNAIPNFIYGPKYTNNLVNIKWETSNPQTYSLYLDSPNEIDDYNNRLFLGGLFIGIGIPLMIQGFVESLKLVIEKLRV